MFCIYFFYGCLHAVDEVWYVRFAWSSVDVDNGVGWVDFACCCVYCNDNCCCFWDMYVFDCVRVYVIFYIYGDVCLVYGYVVLDGVAALIGVIVEVVVWQCDDVGLVLEELQVFFEGVIVAGE
jgi:hypothetical protein